MFLLYLILLEFWIIFESAFIIFRIMAAKSKSSNKVFFIECAEVLAIIQFIIAVVYVIITFFI